MPGDVPSMSPFCLFSFLPFRLFFIIVCCRIYFFCFVDCHIFSFFYYRLILLLWLLVIIAFLSFLFFLLFILSYNFVFYTSRFCCYCHVCLHRWWIFVSFPVSSSLVIFRWLIHKTPLSYFWLCFFLSLISISSLSGIRHGQDRRLSRTDRQPRIHRHVQRNCY